jgi:hypothetical protein
VYARPVRYLLLLACLAAAAVACGSDAADPDAASSPGADAATPDGATPGSGYDDLVLADQPVAYWTMAHAAAEPDRSGHGHDGSYPHGILAPATLPNGDLAAQLDGATQYLTVPSSPAFSVPTTGTLTWEAWIRPDVLAFPHDDGTDGYVAWMGKCEEYSPSCEWEARMYSLETEEGRPSRISAYVFNPGAGLGSAADWQPDPGVIVAGGWYHVVATYTTQVAPADCADTGAYPGSIEIWLNGVKWDHGSHGDTGCMSQYQVVPKAGDSPLDIGTMALDSWFAGAIGKVAIYDAPLAEARIAAHFTAMTGRAPSGSCADTCRF